MNRAVFVGLLTGSLCIVGCKRAADDRQGTNAAPNAASAPSAERAKPLVKQGPEWEAGKHYRYQLRSSSQVSLNQTALYDFDLSGTVDLVLVKREQQADTLLVALDGAQMKSRVPGSQPEFDKLTGTLKSAFFFELNSGLVSASYLPADLHPLAASVFRAIAAALQVAPSPGGDAKFSALEYDTTGQYQADYSRTTDGPGFHKRKQRYLGILLEDNHPKDAEKVIPRIEKSEATIRLNAAHVLTSVEQVDELSFNDAQAPMRSHVELSLSLLDTRPVAANETAWPAMLASTTRLEARLPFRSQLGEANLDAAKARGLSFDTLLQKFEAIAAKPKHKPAPGPQGEPSPELRAQVEEENRLFVALGAVLRQQPTSVDLAVKSVRAGSAASDILIDGLGSAGSEVSQKALVEFMRGKANANTLRNRAAVALGRVDQPAPASVEALLSLVDDEIIGTQALYGLGSYCKIYADSGRSEQAKQLGTFLTQRLVAARSELRQIEALRALANSAYLPALPSIRPLLDDPRTQVRVDAVRSLQSMPSSSVDDLLAERLGSDSARAVKLAAIEAMDERTPSDTLVKALRGALGSDDPHVRYRSVEMMIRWLPKRVDLRDAIQLVAKNDAEPKIRGLAEAAL